MSLHALGGPSKHNAQEEFWRQRLAKEANPASASTVTYGDSRVSAGFGAAQRTRFVPTEPLIPRAGDYRGSDCRNFAETSESCLFAGGGIVLPGSPRGAAPTTTFGGSTTFSDQ